MSLERVNKLRKQDGITHKEYGRVVAHKVPNAVLRVHLDGKAARISPRVRRASFASHCRKANGQFCLFAHFTERHRFGVLCNVVCALKVAERACALCVHHTLRDALVIEAHHLVQVVKVLQQQGTSWTSSLKNAQKKERFDMMM